MESDEEGSFSFFIYGYTHAKCKASLDRIKLTVEDIVGVCETKDDALKMEPNSEKFVEEGLKQNEAALPVNRQQANKKGTMQM